jgi:DNA-binding transcriptional LysR family regulator
VTYAVNQRSPADVVEDVATGHAEIGISFANVAGPSVRLLAEIDMPIGVVLAADHALAEAGEIRLEDCRHYPILLMPDVQPMRPMIEQDFSRAGRLVDPKVVTNSLDMMKHLVAAGTGIAFFTRLAFGREIARGDLVHVPLVDASVARLKLAIMVQRDSRLAPAADSFVDFMTARFLAL